MDEQSITEEEGRVTWTLREKQRGEVKRVKQVNSDKRERCFGSR